MLSLYINSARVGSTRLNELFRGCGFMAYNEPFHTINDKNEKKKRKSWGGDRSTIINYSNLNLEDITFDTGNKIKKIFIKRFWGLIQKRPTIILLDYNLTVLSHLNLISVNFLRNSVQYIPVYLFKEKI